MFPLPMAAANEFLEVKLLLCHEPSKATLLFVFTSSNYTVPLAAAFVDSVNTDLMHCTTILMYLENEDQKNFYFHIITRHHNLQPSPTEVSVPSV
jgi:hypothetical protein